VDIQTKAVNNLRVLACDTISNAKSGHSGIVLSAAPILFTLFTKHLKFSPKTTKSIFRDRFVLSAGHGSALLYSLLHLLGHKISIDDLKNFRKIDAKTSGHPEVDLDLGIECTTGPLGQGVSTAVGMAIAQKSLSRYNKSDCKLFDNKIYTLIGDGCLMEGVSYEALSIAGNLCLDNLIVLYDSNNNTLDSDTSNTLTMNTQKYIESLGFEYMFVKNGNEIAAIDKAIARAKKAKKPVFIEIKTVLGYGSQKEGLFASHGLVMDDTQIKELRLKLGVNSHLFEIEKDAKEYFNNIVKNNNIDVVFKEKLNKYKEKYPSEYKLLSKELSNKLLPLKLTDVMLDKNQESTRNIASVVLNKLAEKNINIIGGAADLSSCTKAIIKKSSIVNKVDFSGKNIFYGVREFGMGCIANGLALAGYKTFASTFMVFSDYLRSAIRSSAIMKLPVVYIFSHDSIAVGEDGPTHQPIEQLSSFRAMPNLNVFRPCNLEECIASYNLAFSSIDTPSIISLTRQVIDLYPTPEVESENLYKGGYIISKENNKLDWIIIATGSEIPLAIRVKNALEKKGYGIRVVSMCCAEIFEKQTKEYKESVLPSSMTNRVAIEAGASQSWHKYVDRNGYIVSVDDFGKSGSFTDLLKYFKLTDKDVLSLLK